MRRLQGSGKAREGSATGFKEQQFRADTNTDLGQR